MRVVCPTCQAAYEVPAAVVQAGRALRCTGCGSQFPAGQARPADPAPQPAPVVQAASAAPPRPDGAEIRPTEAARLPMSGEPVAAVRSRASAAVLAGWVLSLVILGTGAGAALAWRQQIMTAWPPSTRAYAALGFR